MKGLEHLTGEGRKGFLEVLREGGKHLKLTLSVHDFYRCFGLPNRWLIHHHPRCLEHKRRTPRKCALHCGGVVHGDCAVRSDAHRDTCTFGVEQWVVSLRFGGSPVGVLYAAPESPEAFEEPQRRLIIEALAARLEKIIAQDQIGRPGRTGVEGEIVDFLQVNLRHPIRLKDLAEHLHRSPSRTSHLVVERFHKTFRQMLLEMRLEEAALRLRSEGMSIRDIAHDLCFSDQSHFQRTFRKRFGTTPLKFRGKDTVEV